LQHNLHISSISSTIEDKYHYNYIIRNAATDQI
jgi:hypothetical protein